MRTESLIDGCVDRLRAHGLSFELIASAPWVAEVEAKLGLRFVGGFRSLITRFRFPVSELKGAELFSNQGDGSEYDLSAAPFRDSCMSGWLSAHQFIHIGFPHLGNYDPICLAIRGSNEPRVVQLDHEAILMEQRKVKEVAVADTFAEFLALQVDA